MPRENSPIQTKILIDGVDVTEVVVSANWKREYSVAVSSGSITCNRRLNEFVSVTNVREYLSKEVVIWRGINDPEERRVFWGTIRRVRKLGNAYVFDIEDKLAVTIHTIVTTTFDRNISVEGGVISEIFKTLLSRHTTLNFDSESIQHSGEAFLLDKFECRSAELFERLDELADILNWQFYYEPHEDKVFFEPLGFQTESLELVVGDAIVETPEWDIDKSKLTNALQLNGAIQEVQETVFANGTNEEDQQVFLNFQPTSVKVFVGSGTFDPFGSGTKPSDNPNNLQQGGKRGSTSGDYDYEYDDDPQNRVVTFKESGSEQPSFIPPTGENNIEIQYAYDLPTPVTGRVFDSIDTYGIYEKEITKSDIKTIDDAETYLNNYLDLFSEPFVSTELHIEGVENIFPGRQYSIIDDINEIEETLVATEVRMEYPYRFDRVNVGDEQFRKDQFESNTYDRLKRLEERSNKSSDLLVQVFSFDTDFRLENRYTSLEKNNIEGTIGVWGSPFSMWGEAVYGTEEEYLAEQEAQRMIWDSALYGTWDEDLWAEDEWEPPEPNVIRMIPGNNVFKEFVYDDEFFDEELSEGVEWDTNEETITITPGGILYTKPLSVDIPYTEFRVSFGNIFNNENLLTEISYNNGVNWIEITPNTTISFPEPATIVLARMTNIYEE